MIILSGAKKPIWKAGWREFGGVRKYYRSKMEANYGRYLEFLRVKGLIRSWLHEPETFWFPGIKRGVVSYLPDFKVETLEGKFEWHEVKGYMTPRNVTAMKRMYKYHREIKIIMIKQKLYKQIENQVSRLIQGWE